MDLNSHEKGSQLLQLFARHNRALRAYSRMILPSVDPIQFDLLFGEKHGNLTFGLLLVEREGEDYEKTFWGQPKWPLMLTEEPSDTQLDQFSQLRTHMEEKLMGSFSVSNDAIWDARETSIAR